MPLNRFGLERECCKKTFTGGGWEGLSFNRVVRNIFKKGGFDKSEVEERYRRGVVTLKETMVIT